MKKIIKAATVILLGIIFLSMCLWEYNTQNGKTLITNTEIDKIIERSEKSILSAKFAMMKADISMLGADIALSGTRSVLRNINTVNLVYRLHREKTEITKPSYKQLATHIVYITGVEPKIMYEDYVMKREKRWVGTGFVFKMSDEFTWIITNKHVAGIKNNKEGETTELYVGDSKK